MRSIALLGMFLCAASAQDCVLPAGAILRVKLAPNSPRTFKANRLVEGSLEQPVYHGRCKLLSAGTAAKASREGAGVRLELEPPGLNTVAVKAAALRFSKERRSPAGRKPEAVTRVLLLRVDEAAGVPGAVEMASAGAGIIQPGTQVRVAVESEHGSKASRRGEPVRARLLEPLCVEGKVLLPEGTVVNGTLTHAQRARRLYRAGSLRLSFHSLQVDSGRALSTPLIVASGQLTAGSRVDGEGAITGSALTKKRALINLGISYATGKIIDDVIEESAKSIYGIAAAGSAETAARYVGLGAGVALFLLHRGREVNLQPHTELVLTFSRPVQVSR